MRNVLAIVERELKTYFISPVAYVVLTIFAFLSGIYFSTLLGQILQYAMMQSMQGAQMGRGAPPIDMPGIISQNFLQFTSVVLLFLVPMMTMGLFAEEKKRGTIELLLTAPITDLQVVLGKFFAAVSFYVILLATTLIPMAVLYVYGAPASGPILSRYIGMLLYGLALVSIGLFISTLTENQIVSGVLSFGLALVLWLADAMASQAEGVTKEVMTYLSILSHLDDFMKGVLATPNIIFYLSFMLLGLFLTYRSIDSLRWRG